MNFIETIGNPPGCSSCNASLFKFITTVFISIAPYHAIAQAFSAEEIATVCGGLQTWSANGTGGTISLRGGQISVIASDGNLEVKEGGRLLAKIEDLDYRDYLSCLEKMAPIGRNGPSPPKTRIDEIGLSNSVSYINDILGKPRSTRTFTLDGSHNRAVTMFFSDGMYDIRAAAGEQVESILVGPAKDATLTFALRPSNAGGFTVLENRSWAEDSMKDVAGEHCEIDAKNSMSWSSVRVLCSLQVYNIGGSIFDHEPCRYIVGMSDGVLGVSVEGVNNGAFVSFDRLMEKYSQGLSDEEVNAWAWGEIKDAGFNYIELNCNEEYVISRNAP